MTYTYPTFALLVQEKEKKHPPLCDILLLAMNYKPSACLYELLQITFNYDTLSSKHLTKQQM